MIETGVLLKELLFGLVAFALGVTFVQGTIDARNRSFYDAAARLGTVLVVMETLLAIVGVPDLSWRDWHVWALGIGCVLVIVGRVGAMLHKGKIS